jgi:diaminohydroxyphosphoribosylaminopyrimidine deaminase/5-amino-6-(5-phosphoribosylamino)uracil reductase
MNPSEVGDEGYLRRALDLARRGSPTDVNPLVGAVVTDAAGAVIGEGYHRGAGSPHAEIEARRAAGRAARGGTVYVSLEPCSHTGRTGPCVDAIVAAGVARVVFGQVDPNPVAAGGASALEAAGVRVQAGVLAAEAVEVNRTWTHLMVTRRPFVTWKFAATLDGRSAARDGTSRWVTGPEARADVHALRARCGAVIVGTGTVLADDPQLTVRGPHGPTAFQPLRVVVGRSQLPSRAQVLDDQAPTLIVQSHDLREALAQVARRGIHHALLEGGPTLAGSFLKAGLVDEVIAYLAPAMLGAGQPAVGDLGIDTIANALRLTITDVALVGTDVRITARPNPHAEGAQR